MSTPIQQLLAAADQWDEIDDGLDQSARDAARAEQEVENAFLIDQGLLTEKMSGNLGVVLKRLENRRQLLVETAERLTALVKETDRNIAAIEAAQEALK